MGFVIAALLSSDRDVMLLSLTAATYDLTITQCSIRVKLYLALRQVGSLDQGLALELKWH